MECTDEQDGGHNYYNGVCWYRKHVVVQADYAGEIVYLEIGAANTSATVYVTAILIVLHTGGYSAFMFNVPNKVSFGQDNGIAIKVDNSNTILCPPLSADFTFFEGITRNVELVIANPVPINPNEYISNILTMEGINVTQLMYMLQPVLW